MDKLKFLLIILAGVSYIHSYGQVVIEDINHNAGEHNYVFGETIEVGPNVVIGSAAEVSFKSTDKVKLKSGFKAGNFETGAWSKLSIIGLVNIESDVVEVTGTELGSASVNASGGEAPYTYLWELDELPSTIDIQLALDSISYADSLDLDADSINQYIVNRYTGSNIDDLNQGVYSIKVTDSEGLAIEKQIYVGDIFDLVLNEGLSLADNTLTKTNPTTGFENGNATLNQIIRHSNNDEYFWTFTLESVQGESVIGFNKVDESKPVSIQDINYGVYLNDQILTIIDNSVLIPNTVQVNPDDEITLIKSAGMSLRLLVNNQQEYEYASVQENQYYPDVMMQQTGYALSNMQISQISQMPQAVPVGLSDQVTHSTCLSPNSGAISIIQGWNISNIQNVAWTGPNGFVSNQLSIDNLEPGEYTLDMTYDQLFYGSGMSVVYHKSFDIGYYVNWQAETSGISLTEGGGFENIENSNSHLRSTNILTAGESGWVKYFYKRESDNAIPFIGGFNNTSNIVGIYSMFDLNLQFPPFFSIQGMFPIDNNTIQSPLVLGSNLKEYKIQLDPSQRTYSSPLQADVISSALATINSDLFLRTMVAPGQSVQNAVVSFGCIMPEMIVDQVYELSIKPDGGFVDVIDVLKFKFDEEYYRESTDIIDYKVYSMSNTVVMSSGNQAVEDIDFGFNKYAFDISSIASGYYVLEVTDKKDLKWYLRFKK